jgi:hypothetical protein
MHIGFEPNTGHVYEGASAPQFAVWPSPVLSQAKLIANESDWGDLPKGLTQTPFAWVFREDVFDPVTRVRRGRLYEASSTTQSSPCPVSAHPFDHEALREIAASRRLLKNLYTYWPCQTFLNRGDRGLGTILALGQGRSASLWRVIQTELVVSDDVMVTLKAMSAYGIIPEIDSSRLDGIDRQPVERALERVVDSAFRETPISIVDHCRNAATVVLSRWLVKEGASEDILGKDLGEISKAVEREPYKKTAARNAAEVIRLLHPRGKANEQETKGLRIPVEEDAEMAIHALGFILREIGWAK